MSNLLERVNSWFVKYKPYFFTYSKGFFELSYLGNSPESLIHSFKTMPFVKYSESEQKGSCDNMFLKGDYHFEHLEEGFWVIVSELVYKKDIVFKAIYDKSIPREYYYLSLYKNNVQTPPVEPVVKGQLKVPSVVLEQFHWSFFKPEAAVAHNHFKDSNTVYVTIYVSEQWIRKNLFHEKTFVDSGLKEFVASDREYLIWPADAAVSEKVIDDAWNLITEKGSAGSAHKMQLKIKMLELISTFIDKYKSDKIAEQSGDLSIKDRLTLQKVEKCLTDHLVNEFPGIDAIAEKFNMSPTRLKTNFKLFFGATVYQYFLEKRMILARQMLESEDVQVKEIAIIFGYENQGKFSQAFKNVHGLLPSEVSGV